MFGNQVDVLQVLSDAVSEGIVIVDEHQNIVSTNISANAMFGYEANELVGKPLNILIPSTYHHEHTHHFTSFYKKSEKRRMGHGRGLFGLNKNNK